MAVLVKRFHPCATASLHVSFLRPVRTFTRDTLRCTRISRLSVTLPILTAHDARCDPTREATASKEHQEKSNLRFLAWTARQTLPVLLYRILMIQSTLKKMFASEAHVRETTLWNTRYSYLREVSILNSKSSWDTVVITRFSDDTICYEQEQLEGVTQNPRNRNALNVVRMHVRPLSWSLTGGRRICRSRLMIEAYKLSKVVEQELQTGATIFDIRGQLNIHQTIGLPVLKQFIRDNQDVCDEGINGPVNC